MAKIIYIGFALFVWGLFVLSTEKFVLLFNQHVTFGRWLSLLTGGEVILGAALVALCLWLGPPVTAIIDKLSEK